ncbi:MAG TPA: GlsB/YeaQ/YmgE family stress response membrane protein [Anaerolineae bacterium]
MNLIMWLIAGGIVGWLASTMMRTDRQQGPIRNSVVGIIGASAAGLVLTPLLGISTINQNNFSLPGVLVSVMGAIILLALVSLFRGGGLRRR